VYAFRLFKRELSPRDRPRIVRLKHERALLHAGNPVLGRLGRARKSTRPFDPRQLGRNRMERGGQATGHLRYRLGTGVKRDLGTTVAK
jgi:hypothetical protein